MSGPSGPFNPVNGVNPVDPDDAEEAQDNGPQSVRDLDLEAADWDALSDLRSDAQDAARASDYLLGEGLDDGAIKREGQRFSRQSIEADSYDRREFDRACAENDAIMSVMNGFTFNEETQEYTQNTTPWPYPLELARDIYAALYKMYPVEDPDLDPRLDINRIALRALMASPEYEELHASTQHDEFASAVGITVLGEKVLKDENLAAMAQAIADGAPPMQGENESDEDYQKRLAQWRQDRQTDQRRLSSAMRQAAKQASDDVEDAQGALGAFGGPGLSDLDSHAFTGDAKRKAKLAQKVLQNQQLRKIALLAGRFRRVAAQAQRSRVQHTPDEVYATTQGAELDRLLPTETMRLADPELEQLFYRDYAERRLQEYELSRPAKEMRGPIIVAVDESGSMSGDADAWAKAAFLALHGIARAQTRDIRLIHFSSGRQLRTDDYLFEQQSVVIRDTCGPRDAAGEIIPQVKPMDPEALMESVLWFYGGGTDYDPWMRSALESVKESRWDKADVILISDGEAYVSDEVRAEWQAQRAARGFKAYGVLIMDYGGGDQVEQVTDAHTILRHGALGDAERDTGTLLDMFGV